MASLRGEEISGRGRSEAAWAQSTQLAGLPVARAEWLVGTSRRVVVVAPHPDDEVLGCGGLLATLAAHGHCQIVVVSATDGEAAYLDDAGWPASRLAAARHRELEDALAALGVAPNMIVRLDLGDGTLAAKREVLARQLEHMIQPSDTVLVTYAADGHPDHEACADAATEAARRRGARLLQYPVWAWHWGDIQHAAFLEGAVRLPLTPAAHAAKLRAITAFRTQTGHSVPPPRQPILPDWALARFRRDFEVFIP